MNNNRTYISAWLLTLLLPVLVYPADGDLNRNPFTRPALVSGSAGYSGDGGATGEFTLKATLVAGTRSMANINGRFVRIGQEIDGYTLVEVQEGKAVFVKDGSTLSIAVFDSILDGNSSDK